MSKKIVFIDMDGVIADFDKAAPHREDIDPPEMYIPNFYINLEVMPGADEGIATLLSLPKLDVYIGTKGSTGALYNFTEKAQWISMYFPRLLKKLNIVCDKSLLRGDFLIDDMPSLWKHKFQGEFITFDKNNPEKSWKEIAQYFKDNYS